MPSQRIDILPLIIRAENRVAAVRAGVLGQVVVQTSGFTAHCIASISLVLQRSSTLSRRSVIVVPAGAALPKDG